jgi:predicted Zn-dependent protease
MNPASPDFHNRTQTSPALFNRCVVDWFGDWSNAALFQVAAEFTKDDDLDVAEYVAPRHAVELAPENAVYRRTLGMIYRDAGLAANAKRQLEAALRLDPKDTEAKAALRGL